MQTHDFLLFLMHNSYNYNACYEAYNLGNLCRKLFTSLKIIDGTQKLKLYGDNQLAIIFSNNNQILKKSKHTNVKFLVIKERKKWRSIYGECQDKPHDRRSTY